MHIQQFRSVGQPLIVSDHICENNVDFFQLSSGAQSLRSTNMNNGRSNDSQFCVTTSSSSVASSQLTYLAKASMFT